MSLPCCAWALLNKKVYTCCYRNKSLIYSASQKVWTHFLIQLVDSVNLPMLTGIDLDQPPRDILKDKRYRRYLSFKIL